MTEFAANQQHSTHASSSSYAFFDDGGGDYGDYDVASPHNASSSSAVVSPSSDSGMMTFSICYLL